MTATPKIQDYAVIGSGRSAALVSRHGSIDWLCWPRFDSPACFAALLGRPEHGRWIIRAKGASAVSRRYRPDTLILETLFENEQGAAALIDTRVFLQQLAGAGQYHQGSTQFVADIAGKQPLAGQGLA